LARIPLVQNVEETIRLARGGQGGNAGDAHIEYYPYMYMRFVGQGE
jgi:hypothetical protein